MRKRGTRGATIIETITAAGIGVLAIGTSIAVFTEGMGSWTRGQLRVEAETQSRQLARVISDRVREAMEVTIDGNGQGLTYRVPARDVNGIFTVPLQWDGVVRRVFHTNGTVFLQEGASTRAIGRNVILTDPGQTGSPSYQLFTPEGPGFVRRLAIKIVTRQQDANGRTYLGRKREWIALRNAPL